MSSSLHEAVRTGDIELVTELLTSGAANVNEVDKFRRSPLHMAAWSGNSELVKLLLRFKADPLQLAQDGFTSLHFAAQNSHGATVCEDLFKKCAKLLHMKIKKGGKTALHLATIKGNVQVVRKLLEIGADPNTKTGAQLTCLELTSIDEIRDLICEAQKGRVHLKEMLAGASSDCGYVGEKAVNIPHDSDVGKERLEDRENAQEQVSTSPSVRDDSTTVSEDISTGVIRSNISIDKNSAGEVQLQPPKKKAKQIVMSHLLDEEDDDA